jgi:hypothetical protein
VTTNGRHPPEQELTASGRHYRGTGSAEPCSASAVARAKA